MKLKKFTHYAGMDWGETACGKFLYDGFVKTSPHWKRVSCTQCLKEQGYGDKTHTWIRNAKTVHDGIAKIRKSKELAKLCDVPFYKILKHALLLEKKTKGEGVFK